MITEHKHLWKASIIAGVYYCKVPYCDAELDVYFDFDEEEKRYE